MTARHVVLVVDDDPVSRHVLARSLRGAGLAPHVVASGTEALAYLAGDAPSVVLLDLVMPPPDGYAVLRAMRDDPRTRDIPVVVLTALEADDDVARAFGMGADDFVRKPFRPAELVARIRSQLRMREYVEQLARREHFLDRVIESSADAIVSADMRGTVTLYNRAAERLYGYPAAEAVGRLDVRSMYPPGVAREVMRLIEGEGYGGPGRLEGYRTEVVAKDGARIPVMVSAALILEGGAAVGSVGIFTDLRERLRIEAQLAQAQDELRAREKQAMIADLAGAAAHELNQPLTSVLGYAELIRRRIPGESPLTSAASAVLQEAERMAEIVRKIGKITRYETKSYVGASTILDLDRSSADEERAAR